jgi:3-oxoacyl-[acyl-carrier protein] reductase
MESLRILITGGNKGIGLETSKILSEKGHQIIVVARENVHLKGIKNCEFIEYDLRNTKGIKDLIDSIGHIDVLINNSGIMNTCPYDNYSEQEKEDLMKVNLDAPIELITCVSKQMKERKSGRIVNVASVAGQIGHPDVWYGISKAGLINATKSFAKIMGPHGILINAVAPGPVETDMLGTIPAARKEAVLKSVYSGRFAQPEEVAKTILWLALESPEYINGFCIDLNNGSFPR